MVVLPNVYLLGIGFDAAFGLPLLNSTRAPVTFTTFEFNRTLTVSGTKYLIPDQSLGRVLSSVDENSVSQIFTSSAECETTIAADLSVAFPDNYNIPGSFAMSSQCTTFRAENSLFGAYTGFTNQRVKSWALSLVGFLNSTSDFYTAVVALPQTFTIASCPTFKNFISRFGTHFINQALYGGAVSMTSLFSAEVYRERGPKIVQDLRNLFDLLTSPTNLTTEEQQLLENLELFYISKVIFAGGNSSQYPINEWRNWTQTVPSNPIPVSMDLQPIWRIIPSQLSSKRAAVQQAVETYLGHYLPKNQTLDPGPGNWTFAITLPSALYSFVSGFINGTIYCGVGYTSSGYLTNGFFSFDSSSNSWISRAYAPVSVFGAGSSVVGNRLYLVGGYSSTINSNSYFFDITTGSWSSIARMPTARYYLSCATIGTMFYALGGYTYSISNVNEAYNTATGVWSTMAPMPTARYNLVTAVVDGIVYAIGGQISVAVSNNEAFNPQSNSWSTKAPIPTAVTSATASVIDKKIYVCGGTSPSFSYLNIVQIYDPSTDSWSSGNPMPIARNSASSVSTGSTSYILGGYNSTAISEIDVYELPGGPSWC